MLLLAISGGVVLYATQGETAEEAYYRGVWDACMVTLYNMSGTFQDDSVAYCDHLTESSREADAFNDQLNLPGADA